MKFKSIQLLSVLIIMLIISSCSASKTDVNDPPSAKGNQTVIPSVRESSGLLFTANEGGSISMIDLAKNEVVKTIEINGSVHNVQLSPDGKILAATIIPKMNDENAGHSDGEDHHGHEMVMNGTANFYESESGKLIKSVEVGLHPAHVVFTNDGKFALVTNNESNNVSIIDTNTYAVTQTITTGKGPHGFRISKDDRYAYIANMGEDTVSLIDLIEKKETKRIKVGDTPVTTSVTTDGNLLAVTLNSENALAIVDLSTGQIEKVPVGVGPAQVYIQSDNHFAFVANQGTEESPSRTVSKIDLSERKVVETIETGDGAHGLITSTDLSKLYVTNMFDNTLSVIDNETNVVIGTIKTGEIPNGVTVTP